MSTNKDIVVVLSTFNGGKFVRAQLESLRSQSEAERIHLLIRDDGSTDQTISIIEQMDLSPLSVEIIAGENLGVCASFTALAQVVPDHFTTIMFCDQDDVWFEDKARVASAAIAQGDPSVPTLYCSRSVITDEDLTPKGRTNAGPKHPCLHHALFQNIAPGHTMAFNQALLEEFKRTIDSRAIIHDWWAYLLAAALGVAIFDPEPHAYYRLHDSNEIGYAVARFQMLSRDLARLINEDRSALTLQAQALFEAIGDRLSSSDHALLTAFLAQDSPRLRWNYLRDFPMIASPGRPPFVSTALFLLGRYRIRA